MVRPQSPTLKQLRGPHYRYFSEDPDGEGRGPGEYRIFRGRYYKRPAS